MKLTIPRAEIVSALAKVKEVVPNGSNLPVLACVKLEAGDGQLTIHGTDLDMSVSLTIEADVEKAGVAVVSSNRLTMGLAKATGENAEIDASDKKHVINCVSNGMKLTLSGLDPGDFPADVQVGDAARQLKISGRMFAAAMRTVLPFVSTEDTARPVLCGEHLSAKAGRLRFVATDGKRLTLVAIDAPDLGDHLQVIVPTKAVKVIANAVDEKDEITVRWTDSLMEVATSECRIVTKLIAENYPDFAQVIPDDSSCGCRITVDRAELMQALPFCSSVHVDKATSVRLTTDGNSLKVKANSPDVGEAIASLAAKWTMPIDVAYNARFLEDALRAVGGEEVTLTMADHMAPLRLERKDVIAVVMPMRVS